MNTTTSFRDSTGREFHCTLNTAAVAEIQRSLSIDIRSVIDGTIDIDDRLSGGAKLIGMLWIASETSATEQGVTPDDFGESLGGDSLDDAVDALLQAIVSFLPRSQRPALQAVLAKGASVRDEVMSQVIRQVDRADVAAIAKAAAPALYTETSVPPGAATN